MPTGPQMCRVQRRAGSGRFAKQQLLELLELPLPAHRLHRVLSLPRARAGRRSTLGEKDLPAISRGGGFRDNARDFGGVHAVLGDARAAAVLLGEGSPVGWGLRALKHTSVGLTGVREGLSLSVVDIEQPLLRPRLV